MGSQESYLLLHNGILSKKLGDPIPVQKSTSVKELTQEGYV